MISANARSPMLGQLAKRPRGTVLDMMSALAARPRQHVMARRRTAIGVASWPGESNPKNEFEKPQDPAIASGVEGVIYPWNRGYQIWSALTTAAAALTGVVVPLQIALGIGSNE